MVNTQSILMAVGLFLLLVPFVSATPVIPYSYTVAQPFTNPTPTIVADYFEEPVFLLDNYYLAKREAGIITNLNVPISVTTICTPNTVCPGGSGRIFHFSIDQQLPDTYGEIPNDVDYVFVFEASDQDNNMMQISTYFEIDANEAEITLLSPSSLVIADGTVGMSTTGPTFDLTISSNRKMDTCRVGFPNEQFLTPHGFDGPSATNDWIFNRLVSSISQFPDTSSSFQKTYPDFSMQNVLLTYADGDDPERIVVICKESGRYSRADLYVGYDTTPMQITDLSIDPSAYTSESISSLEISRTTDDRAVCSFENTYWDDGNKYVFPDFNPSTYSQFDKTSSEPMNDFLTHILNTPCYTSPCTYTFQTTCTSLTNEQDQFEIDFPVDIERDLTITSTTDYYQSTTNPTLSVTTTIPVACYYRPTGGTLEPMNGAGTLEHSIVLSGLSAGLHNYEVQCTTKTLPITFLIDLEPPTTPVLTQSTTTTCGALTHDITATSSDTESGLDHFEYAVSGFATSLTGTATPTGGEATISIPGPFTSGTSYSAQVTAFDQAGKSSSSSISFTGSGNTDVSCDEEFPTTTYVETETGDGVDVTIVCDDVENNCRDTFKLFESDDAQAVCPTQSSDYPTTHQLTDVLSYSTTKKLCWMVSDKADHEATGEAVIHAGFDIALEAPQFGISPTKTFDFLVSTRLPGTCRQGAWQEDFSTETSAYLYGFLSPTREFDTSDGLNHEILSFDSFALHSELAFNQEWFVVCKSGERYAHKRFTLGYDTTPPVVTITADPNPIYVVPYATDLVLTTDGDLVYCDYTDYNNIYHDWHNGVGNDAFINHYLSSYTTRLPEVPDSFFPDTTPTSYTYHFGCKNLAGSFVEPTYTVDLDPQNDVSVTLTIPSLLNISSVPIVAETYVDATCTYQISTGAVVDDSGDLLSVQNGNVYTHSANSASISDGTHTVSVYCLYDNLGDLISGADDTTTTIDATPPAQPVITAEDTCDLQSAISVDLSSVDEGVGLDFFDYTVVAPDNSVVSANSVTGTVVIPQPIIVGTYQVQARAHDLVGQVSTQASASIIASSPTDPACDTVPPTTSVVKTDTGEGVSVQIMCSDDQGSCDNNFLLKELTDLAEPCPIEAAAYTQNQLTQTFLYTDTVKLCWRVFDQAGNSAQGDTEVHAGFEITIDAPKFGISPTKTFDLLASTSLESVCRQGAWSQAFSSQQPSYIYNYLGSTREFSTTDGLNHILLSFDGFAARSELTHDQAWVIVCKSGDRYKDKQFTLGYDTTPPVMTVLATPNPIYTYPYMTDLSITAQDGEVVYCDYTDNTNVLHDFYSGAGSEDVFSQYVSSYATRLPETPGTFFPDAALTTYHYQIDCVNLAGLRNRTDYKIVMDPQNDLSIDLLTPSVLNKSTIPLIAKTLVDATCTYQVSLDGSVEVLGDLASTYSSGFYEHTALSQSVIDATHDVTVYCLYDNLGQVISGAAQNTVTTDSSPPSPPTILATDTCNTQSSTSISLSSVDDLSGVAFYKYVVNPPSGSDIKGKSIEGSIIIPSPLTIGSYDISAYAYDAVGHRSQQATKTLYVRGPTDPLCDTVPPTTLAQKIVTANGVDVTITCSDDKGPCASEFLLAELTDLSAVCPLDAGLYTSHQLSETISYSDTTKICWRVFDQAGNPGYGDDIITAGLTIAVLSPKNNVAPTKSFNFTVTSEQPGVCRQAPWITAFDTKSPQYIYDASTSNAEFSTSNGLTHTINPFNGLSGSPAPQLDKEWVVTCKSGDRYDMKRFLLGYDTTPPTITVGASPNPIYSVPYTTTINVQSENDRVFCEYYDYNNYYHNFYGDVPDDMNMDNYQLSYTTSLPDPAGSLFPDVSDTTYSYTFTCKNAAGLIDEKTFDVLLRPQNNLVMDLTMDTSFSTSSVPIEVTTLLAATCTYQVSNTDGASITGDLSRSQDGSGYVHTASPNVADGDHTVTAYCLYDDGMPLSSSKQQDILVDATPPSKPEFIAEDTCQLSNDYAVTLSATDSVSGVDHFSYTITPPLSAAVSGQSQNGVVVVSAPLEKGTYTISAKAVDGFGHESSEGSATFTALDPSNTLCDKTSPVGSVTTTPVNNGFSVTVSCSDANSGCQDHYGYALIPPDDSCSTHELENKTFASGPFTVKETSRLCWKVYDNANPPNTDDGTQIVTGGNYISLLEPRFGVSPAKKVSLSVETVRPSTCRQGIALSNYNGMTDEQRYNALVAQGSSTEFTTTGNLDHQVIITSLASRPENEYATNWVVACVDDTFFTSRIFVLGYDVLLPLLDVSAIPNPLREPIDLSSHLYISSDDEVLCTYVDYQNVPRHFYGSAEPDYFNPDHYATSYDTRIPEDEAFFFDVATYAVYPYVATCTNLAGNKSIQGVDLVIDPSQDVSVIIGTPAGVQTHAVLINASTYLAASCTYSVDNLPVADMSSTDDYYHSAIRQLPEGPHTLFVNCDSIYNLYTGSAEKDIVVDVDPPSVPTITTTSPTCSLTNPIKVRFQSDDLVSGVAAYEYEVTDFENSVMTGTTPLELFTIPLPLPLQNTATYDVRAKAIDNAGHESAWSEKTRIEVTHDGHPDCDETPPTGWVDVVDTTSGANVDVHCSDQGSGCTQTYRYATLPLGSDCASAAYSTKSYDQPVSLTEDRMLCWEVEDAAGNTADGSVDITVSLVINLVEPTFGITENQTGRVVVETDRAATCKAGFLSPTHPATLSDWYSQLLNWFDQTGNSQHVINDFGLISYGASSCAGLEECEQPVVVICTENNRYHYRTFSLGYDVSAPSLSMALTPEVLYEPQDLRSIMSLTSNDEVWCFYESDLGATGSFYPEPDITNTDQYLASHMVSLGYFAPPPVGTDSYQAVYTSTCVNRAGKSVTAQKTLTVSPQNQVSITINTPSVLDKKTVSINVTTDLISDCDYRFDPNQKGTPITTTTGTEHTKTHSFTNDGIYNLIVQCQARSGPYAGSVSKELFVDATPPQLLGVDAPEYSCGSEELSAIFSADSGVVGLSGYNYSIRDQDGQSMVDWTFIAATGSLTATEQFALTPLSRYTWEVKAIDELGRSSAAGTATTEARTESQITCDVTKPKGAISAEEVYGGYDVYVTCDDAGSGCTTFYDYLFTPLAQGNACTGDFQGMDYASGPRYESTSGQSCYVVYDRASLSDEGSLALNVIDSCSNGFQDPGEEGVDCGGVCSISCETCSNGFQDPGEEGVDCGGVCAAVCEPTCGNGVVESGEECDGTSDITCNDLGFSTGTLLCTNTCTLNTLGCSSDDQSFCGNGVVESGEECDGTVTSTISCEDFSMVSGSVSCTPTCKISTSTCLGEQGSCGNDIIDVGETCEEDVPYLSCQQLSFTAGTTSCDDDCSIVTSSCIKSFCGDTIVQQGESCDGMNWGNIVDCTDISNSFVSGVPTCTTSCHFDTANCQEEEKPQEDRYDFCEKTSDCVSGEECVEGYCLTPEEAGENDVDWNDVIKEMEPKQPLSPAQKKTKMILFIIGGLLILGGAGFLSYEPIMNLIKPPPPKPPSSPSSPSSPRSPVGGVKVKAASSSSVARQKKIDPKEALRQAVQAHHHEERLRERQHIIDAFKSGTPLLSEKKPSVQGGTSKTGKDAKDIKDIKDAKDAKDAKDIKDTNASSQKTSSDEQKSGSSAGVKSDPVALAKKKSADIFTKLRSIEAGRAGKGDVFSALAELTGNKKSAIHATFKDQQPKAAEMKELFKDAKKSNITPNRLTPVLKHLVAAGHLKSPAAQSTVHHLAKKELITENQKKKIMTNLKRKP